MNPNTFWKLLLISSILIGVLGVFALGNLDTNISGDGIPNKPQKARAHVGLVLMVVYAVCIAAYGIGRPELQQSVAFFA